MRIFYTAIIALLLLSRLAAGQYAPAAGEAGSSAIHRDSTIFIAWATQCKVERGYIKISDTSFTYEDSNKPTLGMDTSALGVADGVAVSLGDRGYAVMGFEEAVYNGEGADFAVFENGFIAQEAPFHYFLELAFVEVSSDSLRWVRFPAYSETNASPQVATFDQMDPEKVHNLAGKYQVFYGTPFDLEDIKDSSGIDLNHISYLRIIDVVGCIHPSYASYDAEGRVINEPWPTPFNSGGFDLDAVGLIHSGEPQLVLKQEMSQAEVSLFPNPVQQGQEITLRFDKLHESTEMLTISIFNSSGAVVLSESFKNEGDIKVQLPKYCKPGIYHITSFAPGFRFSNTIVITNN